MRRVVVVALVGGAVVTTVVLVSRRRALAGGLVLQEPDWAPLTLAGPVPDLTVAETVLAEAVVAEAVVAAAPTSATKWVEPDADGGCPGSHPIKANRKSGIFHQPGGRFYASTRAQRCYCDAEAAEADGLRASKS
jgi:hypothetical protein